MEGERSLFLEPVYFPHTLESDLQGCASPCISVSFFMMHTPATSLQGLNSHPPTAVPSIPAHAVLGHRALNPSQSAL